MAHQEGGDATSPPSNPNLFTKPTARWGQERRLEFIEYRLQWDRVINRSDLTAFFGISVPQASLDLSEYARRAVGNLEYDASTKIYRASASFAPVFASSTLERYLEDLLRVAVSPEVPYGSFLGWHPPVATVPRPWRRLDTDTAITVVSAIRRTHSLQVRYQSFSSPSPLSRKLTPHALVSDGYRWHMRAYCHQKQEFRDFLLSRILEVEMGAADEERSKDDEAWRTEQSSNSTMAWSTGNAHSTADKLYFFMSCSSSDWLMKFLADPRKLNKSSWRIEHSCPSICRRPNTDSYLRCAQRPAIKLLPRITTYLAYSCVATRHRSHLLSRR
jgi:hypothetical protein